MFGIPDPAIWGAMVLCFLSTIACIIYGALNWNADGEVEPEDKKWEEEEKKIAEEL